MVTPSNALATIAVSDHCSVHFVKSVLLACEVTAEGTTGFVKDLAEGKSGLSLVFMHHRDSLKSGHSYQNDAHITLMDHLDVSDNPIPYCFSF